MTIDKQRISAVSTLQALGYTFEAGAWRPPLATAPVLRSSEDFELLCIKIRQHFNLPFGDERAALLFSEIKGWGWFR